MKNKSDFIKSIFSESGGEGKRPKDWNFDPVFNKSVENLKASVILRYLFVCLTP